MWRLVRPGTSGGRRTLMVWGGRGGVKGRPYALGASFRGRGALGLGSCASPCLCYATPGNMNSESGWDP